MPSATRREAPATLRILPIAFVNFCTYLGVGLPLAVLPVFVVSVLGYSPLLAGLSVSVQFVATLLSRSFAGRLSDAIGPKRTVHYGLMLATAGGALLMAAALATATPALCYGLIVASRLTLGVGESCSGTGTIAWNIGRMGVAHAGRVMSWGGIAAYGAIAAGAPIGAALYGAPADFWLVGLASTIVGLVGLGVAALHAATEIVPGVRTPAARVIWIAAPFGAALTLGSAGLGAVASFGTLMFLHNGWDGAPLFVALFGLSFAGSRLILGGAIETIGGYRLAALSLASEAVGLALIAFAHAPLAAFVGAGVGGFGLGLVFPSLGVELIKRFPASSRGAALGVYTVFLDIALASAGPLAGALLPFIGYAGVFQMVAASALTGILFVGLSRRGARPS
jgi:MFS family permease